MQKFTATEADKTKRLDLVLTLYLDSFSRSTVRKMLDQGKVSVNGQIEYRPNYKVMPGDEISVESDAEMQRKQLPPTNLNLEIVYKDQDIVIVNKPVGLKVHPVGINDTESLLNGLYYELKDEITEYGISLVNRIDSGTSGLVVAAISPTGAWHYSKQFAQAKVRKEYLVVVPARWASRYGEEMVKVGNFLNYDWQKRMQTVSKDSGSYALTYFQMLSHNPKKGYALLRAIPKTGRTHQIRIHLSYQFLPILGDKKYGGAEYPRLMLHSHKLGIENTKGEELEVVAEPSPEFYELTS